MKRNTIEKAVLLAGGEGRRLMPFTSYTSKHLLPVFDRPMIMYPLTNLILLGVRDIYIVINPKHRLQWLALFATIDVAANLTLIDQEEPEGIPQAITLCAHYLEGSDFYLMLGDNLLLGTGFLQRLQTKIAQCDKGAMVVGCTVDNPQEFGVAEFDIAGELIGVHEKPCEFVSNVAVTGLYKFDSRAIQYAAELRKSERGEFEICDLIGKYIAANSCGILMCNETTDFWLDTGSIEAIVSATSFLRELSRSGFKTIGEPKSC